MSYREGQHNRHEGFHFLEAPPSNPIRKTLGHQFIITEEILRKSINQSYIGVISGRQQEVKQEDVEAILPSIQEEKQIPEKRHRINFSQFREEPTVKIFKPTQSRVHDGQKSGRSSVILEQPQINLIQLPSEQSFTIGSFEAQGQKQILYNQGCMLCAKQLKKRCKLELLNESTLEVYLLEQDFTVKSTKKDPLLFCVNFDTTKVELAYVPQLDKHSLTIVAGTIRLLLEHIKPEVVATYYKQLQQMQKQSKGQQLGLNDILNRSQFYLRRYQTEEFFVNHCETGDIILFEDTHFFAKAQRFFTNSDFDHVAVAIKDNNYGLLLFESMSKGVSLTPWRSVIRFGWYENIPRIVWRKLTVERDFSFYAKVEEFVKANIEKSYHISLAKLTAQQSMIHASSNVTKKNSKTDKQNTEQGFFCSELVATLYKDLGLLTRDTKHSNYMPACTFYPKDFSTKGGRKLDKGELSPEYDIYFDKELLKLNYKNFLFK